MKILFSPSEAKTNDGKNCPINKDSFIFPELYELRLQAIEKYQNFIKKATTKELEELFSTKKQDLIEHYKENILQKPTKKAVQRYDGVAFKHLKYDSLSPKAQAYIDENVIIFSNLLGVISTNDNIPEYKLKQGAKIPNFSLEGFYKDFSKPLNDYLENDEILDLRATFYEKLFKPNKPYITMKFIKNNKVVSHYAKAYRGKILNLLAQNNIKSQSELARLQIPTLTIKEIKTQKLKTEFTYIIQEI